MKFSCILLPLIFLLLTGCGTTATDAIPATAFTPSAEKGLAIATITFEGDIPVNDIYRFFYNAQSGDKKFRKQNAGKVLINGRQNKEKGFNGDFNNSKSYLVVIEREPGSYAFTQYSYLDHLGSNGMVSSSKMFSIPFDIKKGEITYLGELDYKDVAEKGTARIFVADYYTRDIPEFKKKYPSVNWDAAVNRTPKSGNNGDGIIDFR